MNSIEDYQNLVSLLKQALEYYADENIYKGIEFESNEGNILFSSIVYDKGFRANFALNKIKALEVLYDQMRTEYNDIMDDTKIKYIDVGNYGSEEIANLFNKLNK